MSKILEGKSRAMKIQPRQKGRSPLLIPSSFILNYWISKITTDLTLIQEALSKYSRGNIICLASRGVQSDGHAANKEFSGFAPLPLTSFIHHVDYIRITVSYFHSWFGGQCVSIYSISIICLSLLLGEEYTRFTTTAPNFLSNISPCNLVPTLNFSSEC